MEGCTKYGFCISKEVGNLRQRKYGILIKYGFVLCREIKKVRQKNDGGLTKYGIEFNKEIKGFGVEKSWRLNKVWIWIV